MGRFHKLTVTGVRKTIRNAVVVDLEPTQDVAEKFDFVPGQYLTFRRDFDGQELRRSYSVCAGKDDGVLTVGIKQVDGGAFSTWANENLKPGDILESTPPSGSFFRPKDNDAKRSYLAFAGGSGITPILSILRTVLSAEPKSNFTLVFANHGVSSIMFREELEDLKNRYMERLAVVHVLKNDSQGSDLFSGRIDDDKCARLFEQWIDVDTVDQTYICGPELMMTTISTALKDHGVAKENIRIELFAGTQSGLAPRRPKTSKSKDVGATIPLSITLDGKAQKLTASPDQSILKAALENEIDVPFSCQAGVCSSCRCKVLAGEVEMIANHSLEDYEVENGYVLACQSFPLGSDVKVDFDV